MVAALQRRLVAVCCGCLAPVLVEQPLDEDGPSGRQFRARSETVPVFRSPLRTGSAKPCASRPVTTDGPPRHDEAGQSPPESWRGGPQASS